MKHSFYLFEKSFFVFSEYRCPPIKSRGNMYTTHIFLLRIFLKSCFLSGKQIVLQWIFVRKGKKTKAPPCIQPEKPLFTLMGFYSFPHCLPVKNRSVVVARNTLPACSTVLGKLGKLGEQGKCWVSSAKPEYFCALAPPFSGVFTSP